MLRLRNDRRPHRVLRAVDGRHAEHGHKSAIPLVRLVLPGVGVRGLRVPGHGEHLHLTLPGHLAPERGRASPPALKRPVMVGKLTKELVYKRLPPGVLEQLTKLNPKDDRGRRRHKHHQFLTEDIGHPHLSKHLASVTTLMRVSSSGGRFMKLMNKAFP